MKRKILLPVSLLFFVGLIILMSCKKESDQSFNIPAINDPVIQNLTASETFKRHASFVQSIGNIAYNEISYSTIKTGNADSTLLFIVPVYNEGKLVGNVEMVDLKNTSLLPNKDTYGINYVNLSKFDMKTKTGYVEMIDLNYDNFLHSKITVSNNRILSWVATGLSSSLKEKYKNLRVVASRTTSNSSRTAGSALLSPTDPVTELPNIYTLCDQNGDHNISFAECYKCASDAITADGFSNFVCDLPIAGWAACWVSKTAACVYVSAKYDALPPTTPPYQQVPHTDDGDVVQTGN
ncbi:MAG: hypothetical protein QM726_10045 [Chitinophagaceae bacterium]